DYYCTSYVGTKTYWVF
nr:immunoglobulin light chain junction region [Macaca mulatta]MOW27403.1 immunoglobulin light chain junction region [Macaca mulatta]MOW27715.1 immunoglobulin light chain junction region [Macaca mulatta]MOW28340.1 immunoglobulin light chain junction region [Macaca mulatta]MOW28617.1 immunoglobulin light chain junction region [Macaca mulatta]